MGSKKAKIIAIAILILVVGSLLCFFIFKGKSNSSDKMKITYTASKEITIEDKIYNVSYLYKELDINNSILAKLDLYLNDKRVTTVDLYSIVKDTEYKLKEYEVIPHQFDKDYILVEVKSKLDDNLYEEKNTASLVLISLDSKLIETFEWSNNTKIRRTTTNQILTYEIGKDYIMLYEVLDDKVNKAMYTIKNGQLEKEITREYIIDKDVILNGK